MLLDDFTVLDHPAPGACLVLEHLDERLIAMQVAARCALDEPHSARGFLERATWLDIKQQVDPGQARPELVEADQPGMGYPVGHAPLDPLAWSLRLDLGDELLLLAPDLGRERNGRLVLLGDLPNQVHEPRPKLGVHWL